MASMNYTDSNMTNSTNMVVHFGGKGGNLHLRWRARSHTIYATQVGCSIFQPAKFEQTITHQHVLLQQESLIDGTDVWPKLQIPYLLIFGYVDYFPMLLKC